MESKDSFRKIERKPKYIREETFKYVLKKWRKFEDVEDNYFKPLIDQVVGKSFLITGDAGTGKTTLINKIKKELDDQKLEYIVLTPTNVSALLVEGTTLDKFSKKLAYKSSIENNVKDYIIVDEVSMMREQFYKVLCVVKRVKPDTKFRITGHYRQFGPVNDRIKKPTSFYANSQVLYELCDGNHLKLTNCRRSSDTLYVQNSR